MSKWKYIVYLTCTSSFSFVKAPINNKLQYLLVIILDKVKSSQLVALLVGIMSLFLPKKTCDLDMLLQEILTLGNM